LGRGLREHCAKVIVSLWADSERRLLYKIQKVGPDCPCSPDWAWIIHDMWNAVGSLGTTILSRLLSILGNRRRVIINLDFLYRHGSGTSFEVELTNANPDPIYIRTIRLGSCSGKEIVWSDAKRLEPGELLRITFPLTDPDTRFNPNDIKRVVVTDTIGRTYQFPGLAPKSAVVFRRLKRRIADEWTADTAWF